MTDKLATILECALAELDDSDMWFDRYTNSSEECDWELDWQLSKEHLMKCRGLLEAYEILTGKKIHSLKHDIKEELANL